MLLGGLWHGAAWHFVFWGGLHGLALVVHREWAGRAPKTDAGPGTWRTLAGTVLTFYWVCVCWVFFRAPDLPASWAVLRPFLLWRAGGAQRLPGEGSLVVLFLVLASIHAAIRRRVFAGAWERLPDWAFPVAYGVAVGTVLLFVPQHYAPFIYFQF